MPVNFDSIVSERKFQNVLDLAGEVLPGLDADGNSVMMNSPLPLPSISPESMQEFGPALVNAMNELTHFEGRSIPGRINIMQAPRVVLNAIPGLTEEQIESIITRREFELDQPEGADVLRLHPTWLWAEGAPLIQIINSKETMSALLPYICTGGDVFRAEIIGFFPDGIGTSRAEGVIDTIAAQPRLLFWRDKSHLPSGYSIDVLGIGLR